MPCSVISIKRFGKFVFSIGTWVFICIFYDLRKNFYSGINICCRILELSGCWTIDKHAIRFSLFCSFEHRIIRWHYLKKTNSSFFRYCIWVERAFLRQNSKGNSRIYSVFGTFFKNHCVKLIRSQSALEILKTIGNFSLGVSFRAFFPNLITESSEYRTPKRSSGTVPFLVRNDISVLFGNESFRSSFSNGVRKPPIDISTKCRLWYGCSRSCCWRRTALCRCFFHLSG